MKRLMLAACTICITVLFVGCSIQIESRTNDESETSAEAVDTSEKPEKTDKKTQSTDEKTSESPSVNTAASDTGSKKSVGSISIASASPDKTEDQQNSPKPERQGQANDEHGTRLSSKYIDMFDKKLYYIKYRGTVGGGDSATVMEVEMAMRDGSIVMRMDSDNGIMRVIIADDGMYTVFDGEKVYMVTPITEDMGGLKTDVVATSGIEYRGGGMEEFYGRLLPYEEYSAESAITRYYMDGTNLAGIREIPSDGAVVDMEIMEMSQDIPNGMFEIPQDYSLFSMDF